MRPLPDSRSQLGLAPAADGTGVGVRHAGSSRRHYGLRFLPKQSALCWFPDRHPLSVEPALPVQEYEQFLAFLLVERPQMTRAHTDVGESE